MPFLPILTLIFVIAKMAGVIGWSWWLVFLPMWGPLLVIILIFLLVGTFTVSATK